MTAFWDGFFEGLLAVGLIVIGFWLMVMALPERPYAAPTYDSHDYHFPVARGRI